MKPDTIHIDYDAKCNPVLGPFGGPDFVFPSGAADNVGIWLAMMENSEYEGKTWPFVVGIWTSGFEPFGAGKTILAAVDDANAQWDALDYTWGEPGDWQ